jgi:alpha-tubulin suppressor-like RCC1 family protein
VAFATLAAVTPPARATLGTLAALVGLGLSIAAAPAPAASSGSLRVQVSGLPAGAAAHVLVRGPAGFARVLRASGSLGALPPGSYRLQVAWVHAAHATFATAHRSFTVQVHAGRSAQAAAAYGIRVPDTTKAPPASAVRAVSDLPGSKRAVTLTQAGAAGLHAGDVLALGISDAAPSGLLGRVKSVRAGATGVVVTTVPATLAEAVPDGEFAVLRNLAVSSTQDLELQSLRPAGSCGGVLSAFTPSASLTLAVRLSARWHAAGRAGRPHLDAARFTVDGTQRAAIAPDLLPAPDCGLDAPIGRPALPAVAVSLGPVPVVVTPQVTFDFHADGTTAGAVSYGFAQDATASAGVEYAGGRFRPLANLSNRFTARPVSVKAKATSNALVRSRLDLLIDGIAAGDLAIESGAVLRADAFSVGPAPWWSVRGSLNGDAGLSFDKWLLPLHWSKVGLLASSKLLAAAASSGIPASTALPRVTDAQGHDAPFVGDTLRADAGSWSNPPASISYQWQRCQAAVCSDIPGATGEQYSLAVGDAAWAFQIQVTAGNATGATSASSSATANVRLGGTVSAIGSGEFVNCALRSAGDLFCWGWGDALGNGTVNQVSSIVPVSGLTDATAVDGGLWHTCALRTGGTVACWGHVTAGAGLGNGSKAASTPVAVTGLGDATAISAGDDQSCALRAGGSVACWGWNGNGELGDGTGTDAPAPVAVAGLHDATAISSGSEHSCALRANHTVDCWGVNWHGMLGSDPLLVGGSFTPLAVPGLTDATAVDADGFFTCALRATGGVMCWGDGRFGEHGDGTLTFQSTAPVAVSGITDAVAIAISRYHACALRSGGSVACWGGSDPGQDDAGLPQSAVPVAVKGLTDAVAIAAGGDRTCVLRRSGTVACWGIGDALNPVEVPGL